MIGQLDETYLTALQQQDDTQSSLFDYSEDEDPQTNIAVVIKPNETGILDVVDEWRPALGMPNWKLTEFQKLRANMNEINSVQAHNKAYERLDLDETYKSHLRFNTQAQKRVNELIERLHDGEDITLVCFEKPPKKCHRHVLKEHIENRL